MNLLMFANSLPSHTVLRIKAVVVLLFLILLVPASGCSQEGEQAFADRVVSLFSKNAWPDRPISRDSLHFSWFLRQEFNVSVSDHSVSFDTASILVENPFVSEKDARKWSYEKRDGFYPVSFSVIYDGHIVALFEGGNFLCLRLDDHTRNIDLESRLSVEKFDSHRVVEGTLMATVRNSLYAWDGREWNKVGKDFLPFPSPILYSDEKFIVFRNCHGEWGGTIFFYENGTKNYFFTEATCSNTVTKTNDGYVVLSHLGHGNGFADEKIIEDPTQLTSVKKEGIRELFDGQAMGYRDTSQAYSTAFDLFGLQIFSSFTHNDRELYIFHVGEITFIGEFVEGNIEVVDILFSGGLYTHDPVTTSYDDYTLVNLDFYGTGLYREVSVLLISNGKIVKLDWNQIHDR